MDRYICELCRRVGVNKVTEHHLTPREEGGAKLQTVWLCVDCHKQIHATYTNKELALRLNTLESLEEDDKISSYLKYIRKQAPSKSVKVKKSREMKNKKR